jgi:hypothetical protein
MWTLRGSHPTPLPHRIRLAQEIARGQIQRRLHDRLASAKVDGVPGQQARAVAIPRKIRVDADRIRDVNRFAPLADWIHAGDEQLASVQVVHIRRDKPEPSAVMSKRRAIDAGRGKSSATNELLRGGQDVADLYPTHQIAAVKQGGAGEVLEA